MKYVIGIGTNMGNRLENLKNAVYALELAPKTAVIKKSAVYETSALARNAVSAGCAILKTARV